MTRTSRRSALPRLALACCAMLAATTLTVAPSSAAVVFDPRKNSCEEVREAGLGPYVRDVDPEYGWYRDDDGDGEACGTREAVTLDPSAEWQTERYTRSRNPTFTVDVFAQPDPAGSGRLRGYLQARILSGGTEVWRAATENYVSATLSRQQLTVDPDLADGSYVAQVWSSYSGALDEAPPGTASTLTFVVDTQAPSAPIYLGTTTSGAAISTDPDVRWISFHYADATSRKAAAPGLPVSWYVDDSGPPQQLQVHAIDRTGNVSPPVTRDE